MTAVSVAIPVLNGEPFLAELLAAVSDQRVPTRGEVEVVVADSGSSDRSVEIARAYGAKVFPVPAGAFSHGGTRNELMHATSGDHVAFLTQDALPAGPDWLARLLEGFELGERVGLVFGPYRPRPGASLPVRRELEAFFRSLAPDGRPRVDRREPGGADPWLPGAFSFYSSANGCVSRAAWEQVPFRPVPYAEDRLLAAEMLEAGWAKVFQPEAVAIHSHEYSPAQLFRRAFDEWRGLAEVIGWQEPLDLKRMGSGLRGAVGADWRVIRAEEDSGRRRAALLAGSVRFHALRTAGGLLGSRAAALPPGLRRVCSLEGRASFVPYERAGGAGERGKTQPLGSATG